MFMDNCSKWFFKICVIRYQHVWSFSSIDFSEKIVINLEISKQQKDFLVMTHKVWSHTYIEIKNLEFIVVSHHLHQMVTNIKAWRIQPLTFQDNGSYLTMNICLIIWVGQEFAAIMNCVLSQKIFEKRSFFLLKFSFLCPFYRTSDVQKDIFSMGKT